MPAIKEQQWQEIASRDWGSLADHLWEDFRLALMEQSTEQEVTGVAVERSRTEGVTATQMPAQGVKVIRVSTVAQSRTQMVTSIVVSERDYKGEMLRHLPSYERKSGVFHEVLDAYDREFRNEEQRLEVVERNIFLDTAIEALPMFERDLGIQTNARLSYDQRREQIAARNRASFDQTTEETIKQVAAAYGNGEVEVSRTITPGLYEIKFIGVGIPNNMDGLKKAIDVIIPAHIAIRYAFTFSPWEDIRDLAWSQAAEKTWDELRTWNEVS